MNAKVKPIKYLDILHRFALDLLQHSSLEEIYWLIADQVIAGMGFNDCVIYLRDDKTNTLIQKAAYGPKTSGGHIIKDPITIAMGDGIVGSVAAAGVATRINDTREDPRYIVDDDVRLSELAVPIMLDGHCIGVIDSEHHEADFYTQEHEDLLTTIASMTATKIRDAMHEEALNAIIKQLKQARMELVEQHNELRLARQAAEIASQAKTTFLSHISHEMRTPMTGIIGMTHLLKDTDLSNDQQSYLGMISESANSMMTVVEQLLDLTALESNSVVLHESRMSVVEDLVNHLHKTKQRCEMKGLSFTHQFDESLPEIIIVDKKKLFKLLDVIIDNAIKFTQTGGIKLFLKQLSVENNGENLMLEFEIQDTGIGIDEAEIGKLLQPFTQSDMSNTRKYQGTGLGLAIANKLANLMNGQLRCRNNIQGASFLFTINAGIPRPKQ